MIQVPLFAALLLALSPPADPPADDILHVEMKPLEDGVAREREVTGLGSLLRSVFGGAEEGMVRRGELVLDGKTFAIYLPEKESYSHVNEGENDSHHRNTATRLSVDADGDGHLTRDEAWYANLPIRIGDRMVEVVDLAPDGSRIDLRVSVTPLRGLVMGRKCPPFQLETSDGEKLTLDDFRGKTLILDVWSVT
jgi:hypothetical protein